jgi:hypothetical protein
MADVDFNKTFAPMANFITIKCIFALGLGDPPNKCIEDIFEWNIGGGDLYGPTGGFYAKKQRKPCMQTQKMFVWAQTIFNGVV